MTTIDHQQAAVEAVAKVIAPHAYDKALWRCTLADGRSMEQTASDAEVMAREALTAAAPHLRASVAEEILDDTPGSPLTRGYQRLMSHKTEAEFWARACEAVDIDTDATGGEWQTAFDKTIADYHARGYEAGRTDAATDISATLDRLATAQERANEQAESIARAVLGAVGSVEA